MPDAYEDAGLEPSLEDLLTDPIVRLVLDRDRIDPAELQSLLAQIRKRLQAPACAAAGDQPQVA